ncbi:MAG: hypothetical protein WB819_17195 [Terriglobia bacterium]
MAQNKTSTDKRPKLAAVVTSIRLYSHPQHIVDRFLDGYGWNGTFHHPQMDLVGLYVDQRGEGDLTQELIDRHPGLKVYPSIAEAVTLGTSKLAVDGVVVVGEHGRYPQTAMGQAMQPHFRFFESIVDVFRSSNRSVPYFNDKQLSSWSFPQSKQMFDTSRQMGFPLQGGSSLAVTWRIPSVEFPTGATVKEALCVAYGGVDSYDFHALETIQCMVERRKGGETGVEWLQAYQGESFWKAYEQGVWPHSLVKAALSRSSTLMPASRIFTDVYPSVKQMRQLVPDPTAYRYQYRDGMLATMLLMNGLVRDFTFAAQIEGRSQPFSTQMHLPMPDGRTSLASFFSPLVHNAEKMFLTGKAQYPIARTLLTSGLVIAGVESIYQGLRRLETPQLAVTYQPSPESTFWRS